MFFGFESLPPEVKQIMEHQHNQHQMAQEDFAHSLTRLISELDREQLSLMMKLMQVVSTKGNRFLAVHLAGVIEGELKNRFGVCGYHGVNHDEEVLLPPAPEPSPASASPLDMDAMNSQAMKESMERAEKLKHDSRRRAEAGELNDEDRANMERYHLDDAYQEGTGQFLYFLCTGIVGSNGPCGTSYPSIEDRMLREPEHCSACFERVKHG